jgi:hypothetical protein
MRALGKSLDNIDTAFQPGIVEPHLLTNMNVSDPPAQFPLYAEIVR